MTGRCLGTRLPHPGGTQQIKKKKKKNTIIESSQTKCLYLVFYNAVFHTFKQERSIVYLR